MRSTPPDTRKSLDLADGRRLCFTLTGPTDGHPVLYCHGAIGTPVNATVDLAELTHRLGVRYIAPTRPGIGGSDPRPARSIHDWADDALQLLDALELDQASVVGVSAGGPYALALAHRAPDRIRRVAVVSALSPLCAPHDTPGMQRRIRLPLAWIDRHPDAVRRLGNTLLPLLFAHPRLVTRVMAAHAAPAERDRLDEVAERLNATASFFDSCADGVAGLVEDYRVYARPWGFSPAQVRVPVDLWHGMDDPLVPAEHALQLAAALPRCRTFLDPEEGHHFFRARLGEILEELVRPAATPRTPPASPGPAVVAHDRRRRAPVAARPAA